MNLVSRNRLAETGITAVRHGEHSIAFTNKHVTVNSIPSEFGGFTTVQSGHGAGVAVLIVNQDREILMVNQNRYAVEGNLWEIPRGSSDPGEDYSYTAQREVLEETGIALSLDACRSLGTIYPDTGVLTTEVALFFAELPSGLDLTTGANEIQSTMWVPVEEVIDAVLMNIIKDNYTVSAVMKARLLSLI